MLIIFKLQLVGLLFQQIGGGPWVAYGRLGWEGLPPTCSPWTLGPTRPGKEHRKETAGDTTWKRQRSSVGLAIDDDNYYSCSMELCNYLYSWVL